MQVLCTPRVYPLATLNIDPIDRCWKPRHGWLAFPGVPPLDVPRLPKKLLPPETNMRRRPARSDRTRPFRDTSFESEPPTARKRSEKWMLDCRSTAAAAAARGSAAAAVVADDADAPPTAPRPLSAPMPRAREESFLSPPRTGCDFDLPDTTMVERSEEEV